MTLDMSLDGNHEIECPLCQHIHYRVVKDGVVTEERYRSSAGPVYFAMTTTVSTNIINYNIYTSATTTFTSASWMNRSDLGVT
jgi:hypothetical protein